MSKEPDVLLALGRVAFAGVCWVVHAALVVYFGTAVVRWLGVTP